MRNKLITIESDDESEAPRRGFLGRHPFIVPVTTFLVLFFASLAGLVALGGQTIGPGESHVVRLYINDEPRVIPTHAETVGALLDELGIGVGELDILEPNKETAIADDDFEINLYKSRKIVVAEGKKEVVIETAVPAPADVVKEAGFSVYPEDKVERVTVDIATDPVKALERGLATDKIVITRALPITLNIYGNTIPIRTHAKTVGELFDSMNVKVDSSDTVRPSRETVLKANMQVAIIREGTDVVIREETIPIPIKVIEDPNLPVGTRKIKTAGAKGRKSVTYQVELANGKEVKKRVLQEIIIRPAVEQVEIHGTRGVTGSNATLLHALRMCETGGNYKTNTGNGYYGAYQFSAATWRSMGTAYAYAHQAPPAVQDDAALRLAKRAGFHSQFPGCSAKLGLPARPN